MIGKAVYRLNKKYDNMQEPNRFLAFICSFIVFMLLGTLIWGIDTGSFMGIMFFAVIALPLRFPYIEGWLDKYKD